MSSLRELERKNRERWERFLLGLRSISVTIDEAAKRLGLTESEVERLIEARKILAWRDKWSQGNEWRFPRDQFLGGAVIPAVERCLTEITYMEPTAIGVVNFLTKPDPKFFGRNRIQVMQDSEEWAEIIAVYCRSLGVGM